MAFMKNSTGNWSFSGTLACMGVGNDSVADYLASKVVLGTLYSVVFLLGVSGNCLVIYVVITNRCMHNVTNMFIANLAIADLVVDCTSLWLTPTYSFMNRWVWGGFLCHSAPLFQGSSLFISTLTLTAIAVDRYIVILHPFRQRISIQVCLTVIISVWLLSVMLVTPLAFNMKLTYVKDCQFWFCYESWAWPELREIYGILVVVLQFGVPFVIIAFCYISIWRYFSHRRTTAVPTSDEQRKRRLLKMLVSMVVIFAFCHLPLHTLNILRDFKFNQMISRHFTLFFLIAHLVSMSATCWNPILYAEKMSLGMNESFQREFAAVLPCFPSERNRFRAYSYSKGTRLVNQATSKVQVPMTFTSFPNQIGKDELVDGEESECDFRSEKNGNAVLEEKQDYGSFTENKEEHRKLSTNSFYYLGKTQNDEDVRFITDTYVIVV